jgi:hypothetical protein
MMRGKRKEARKEGRKREWTTFVRAISSGEV